MRRLRPIEDGKKTYLKLSKLKKQFQEKGAFLNEKTKKQKKKTFNPKSRPRIFEILRRKKFNFL